ncbi:hypothetical protein GCM10018785_34880 [Streptomyces longispororuber]|uniref:UspA domain-containing protein n=1 Tax=Streptomyces longispororuber TaxID=68230 RepID=A0A918ZNN9_9ACTN|nr:universal stress protein [Streptomyces longispororuber]GHE62940.1 hypothetical protein GCM10018785_34880 [Streptomyces longispororuber]
MLRPIVVGLDGSRESVAAAHWAAREALRRGLPLRLVHAGEGLPRDDEPVTLPELAAPRSWARRILRGTADRLHEEYPQVPLTTEQIRRPTVPALLAEAEPAELLVLGNQGFGGLGGLLAGSVAMAVVAHTRTPVVLVRAGFGAVDEHVRNGDGETSARAPYRPVVAAVDLRHACDPLLAFAFEAARHRAAPLHVVHAWRLPNTTSGPRCTPLMDHQGAAQQLPPQPQPQPQLAGCRRQCRVRDLFLLMGAGAVCDLADGVLSTAYAISS